jgi:predicted methyltransferase
VVSNAGGTLVVAPDGGGANVSVRTDAATRMLGDRAGAPADLQPGARVVVRVTGSGDARTAVSVSSPVGRVTGTVTAVSGDVVTVLQANGLTVSVNAASANPKPAVGDLVAVTGVPDGTTITATRVRVLPKVS